MSTGLQISTGVVVLGLAVLMLSLGAAPPGEAPGRAETGILTAALADVHAASPQGPEYEGGRSGCRRCHLREYRDWEDTPHASALETLPADERSNPECLQCHTTGYGEESGFQSVEATPELANVTCEACHGPGSIYKDREMMKDREASITHGLVIPDEETCRGCHNAESPTFPGSFDYEEMKEKGVHEISR